MLNKSSRRGIALLMTLMFVMIITVAIGYNLLQVKKASNIVQKEKQLYQSTMIVEDILYILQNSAQLQTVFKDKSIEDLSFFLSTASSIPLQLPSMKVILSLSSARDKFNINELDAANEAYVREYFAKMMVGSSYVDVLKDCMSKNQAKNEYNNYNSVIFDENPYLFRTYIASKEHLDIINRFYLDEYNDENIKHIDFEKLFSFSADMNEKIDLNYATPEVLMLILGTTKERADTIFSLQRPFKTVADLKLNADEKKALSKFKTSFFEPYIHIKIEIINEKEMLTISFDYDMKQKKGNNFVFDI